MLMTCRQQPEQSLNDYLQKLKELSIDCDHKAITAIFVITKLSDMLLFLVLYLMISGLTCSKI